MIVRMEEARATDGRLGELTRAVQETTWPRLQAAAGFLGGELYSSYDGEPRLVLISRWHDEAALRALAGANWRTAALLGAVGGDPDADLMARPPHVWHFTAVPAP